MEHDKTFLSKLIIRTVALAVALILAGIDIAAEFIKAQ